MINDSMGRNIRSAIAFDSANSLHGVHGLATAAENPEAR